MLCPFPVELHSSFTTSATATVPILLFFKLPKPLDSSFVEQSIVIMLSSRAFAMPAAQILRMQAPKQALRMRPTQLLQQTRGLRMQPTARMMRPVPV